MAFYPKTELMAKVQLELWWKTYFKSWRKRTWHTISANLIRYVLRCQKNEIFLKPAKALFRDIIDYCKRSLNNYAAYEQLKQISESLMHEVIRWDSTDNSNDDGSAVYTAVVHHKHGKSHQFDTTVTFQNGSMYECSKCECAIGLGIVCRHYIAVMHYGSLHKNIGLPYHVSFVHRHWHKDSDEIKLSVWIVWYSAWWRIQHN